MLTTLFPVTTIGPLILSILFFVLVKTLKLLGHFLGENKFLRKCMMSCVIFICGTIEESAQGVVLESSYIETNGFDDMRR